MRTCRGRAQQHARHRFGQPALLSTLSGPTFIQMAAGGRTTQKLAKTIEEREFAKPPT